jgi:hypothetical protein
MSLLVGTLGVINCEFYHIGGINAQVYHLNIPFGDWRTIHTRIINTKTSFMTKDIFSHFVEM